MTAPANPLPKILVVDDSPANLLAMRAVLSKLPAQLMTAGSGNEALSFLLRHEFALVLLDVNMPGMNGYETAELIRDHTARDPVPVIFVTAHDAGTRQVFRGYESGAIDYLFKPVDEILLTSKVRVLLDLYEHRTRLKQTGEALALAHRQKNRLLQAAAEGILGLLPDGSIEFVNPEACRLLGASAEALIGQSASAILGAAETPGAALNWSAQPAVQSAVASGLHRERDTQFQTFTGTALPVAYALSAIEDEGAPGAPSFVLLFQDISERKRMEARLKDLAERDPLTGLANRTLFGETLKFVLVHATRQQHNVALLYLDLDGFKPVNDTHGHAAGDQLLCVIAARIASALRKSDLCARLGGDEFAVVLADCGTPQDVTQLAQTLLSSICQPHQFGDQQVQVGASIGFAVCPADASDSDTLVKAADAAMYSAKRAGGNRIVHAGA